MIRTICAALALTIAFAAPASAQSWRVVGLIGDKPDRSVYLVDTDSIVRTGAKIRFTTMTIVETPIDENDFERSVTDREADCTSFVSTILHNRFYRDGAMYAEAKERDRTITYKPGMIIHDSIGAACGAGEYDTGPLTNPEASIRAWFEEN